MSAPSAFLAILLASALGFLFHFLRGGRLARLGLYLGTSWVGFFAGHFVGEWWNWHTLRLGSLNLFAAVLGSLVGLVAANILAGPERGRSLAPRRAQMEEEDEA